MVEKMIKIKEKDVISTRYTPLHVVWESSLSSLSHDEVFVWLDTWRYNSPKELLAHSYNETQVMIRAQESR